MNDPGSDGDGSVIPDKKMFAPDKSVKKQENKKKNLKKDKQTADEEISDDETDDPEWDRKLENSYGGMFNI